MSGGLAAGLATALIAAGVLFYVAGTIGLLRFPDTLSRLHALTKADGAGLGLCTLGLLVLAPSAAVRSKLIVIWGLALAASVASSYVIARSVPDSAARRTDADR